MPIRTEAAMNTVVTMHVLHGGAGGVQAAMDRAFGWFHEIEERCTRFDSSSELMRLTARAGEPAPASAILFEAVRFALLVAEESGGAFDPTIGRTMEARGFNLNHRTGKPVRDGGACEAGVCYKDVQLDRDRGTITLRRPLTLDLGAVAKGLAVDMASCELARFLDFAIDAGGDVYLGGSNEHGEPWRVGIRHPREQEAPIACLGVSNQAVCTSGDYERPIPCGVESSGGQHHILDPRTGASPGAVASATVIADGAMLADALATAAFVLGPQEGIRFLERMGVEGLIVTPELQRYETRGVPYAA